MQNKIYAARHKVGIIACCFFVTACLLLLAHCCSYAQQQIQGQPLTGERSLEEERLLILKADIKREIERHERLKREVEEAKRSLEVMRQERLDKVARIYAAMPPEEAARKLEMLDENTAVSILVSLSPRIAGRILANVESEIAASLSEKMLSQR